MRRSRWPRRSQSDKRPPPRYKTGGSESAPESSSSFVSLVPGHSRIRSDFNHPPFPLDHHQRKTFKEDVPKPKSRSCSDPSTCPPFRTPRFDVLMIFCSMGGNLASTRSFYQQLLSFKNLDLARSFSNFPRINFILFSRLSGGTLMYSSYFEIYLSSLFLVSCATVQRYVPPLSGSESAVGRPGRPKTRSSGRVASYCLVNTSSCEKDSESLGRSVA